MLIDLTKLVFRTLQENKNLALRGNVIPRINTGMRSNSFNQTATEMSHVPGPHCQNQELSTRCNLPSPPQAPSPRPPQPLVS